METVVDASAGVTRPRVVVVTPSGRRRYLELLHAHLSSQRGDFDEWHLWLNTVEPGDVAYCESLAAAHPDWVRCVRPPKYVPSGNLTIHQFFRACVEPGTVYIRVDDDVVWLSPTFVREMTAFRVANPQYFLVFANIVNNNVVSHLQQRAGRLGYAGGVAEYACTGDVGWKSPGFAEHVHRAFLAVLDAGRAAQWPGFDRWELYGNERVSINAISWLGDEFAKFGGEVGADEEPWLACEKPASLGMMNCIAGGPVCVHYAFHTQREHLDGGTDVLARYRAFAPAVV